MIVVAPVEKPKSQPQYVKVKAKPSFAEMLFHAMALHNKNENGGKKSESKN